LINRTIDFKQETGSMRNTAHQAEVIELAHSSITKGMTIKAGVSITEGKKVLYGPKFYRDNQRSLSEHKLMMNPSLKQKNKDDFNNRTKD
jgi:hypothetical protein